MEESLFRKNSVEHITSPEQLNDYLRVTSPAIWVVLIAVIILLAGMLVWASFANIDSFVSGTAQVEDGKMVIIFDDEKLSEKVEAGMTAMVGDTASVITSVGNSYDGSKFAVADTELSDGSYSTRVVYRQTQVIKLLFR
ncbi:MAG: hypothetical protein J6T99_05585 [Oscillospiraceae bacterium]|nr:hypothetical protein [Oscillospiraceae bacterium]